MNNQTTVSFLDQMQAMLDGFKRWLPQLEEALAYSHGTHTVNDIFNMCLQQRLHFYDFPDCFIVMEFVQQPQSKSYHAFLTGGDMQSILDKEPMMMEIGKTLGCTTLSAAGRIGWKRVFERQGWKFLCVTMYKDIPNG